MVTKMLTLHWLLNFFVEADRVLDAAIPKEVRETPLHSYHHYFPSMIANMDRVAKKKITIFKIY